MKKTSLSMRILAMALVLIMTLQIIPANVFAFGELRAVDTGIKVDTIKKDDSINWPIKIYDYLNDGMLFEWNDSTHTGSLPDGRDLAEKNAAPYGGGSAPPVTIYGADYTFDSRKNDYQSYNGTNYSLGYTDWSTIGGYDRYPNGTAVYTRYSTQYHYNLGRGASYTLEKKPADDYKTPMYAHITDGSGGNRNMMISYFPTAQSSSGNIRYMVVAYRASGVESNGFQISITNDTGFSSYSRKRATMKDTDGWEYAVYDLQSICGSYSWVQYVWFSWYDDYTIASNTYGMDANAFVDLTHVGFFSTLQEAHNYGAAAVKFDKNPGEYLRKSASFTATTTTVTPSVNLRSKYLFSLNYHWKTAGENPIMGDADSTKVHYGMDFTSTSKTEGNFTNAYTTNSYWTWANGSPQSYQYTDSNTNQTHTYSFAMNPIGVEQKAESNGAMYVRLTAENKSKILLSKFREDMADTSEVTKGLWVPPIDAVDTMVLVYRANGLDAADQYGLWAQGYQESSANYTTETVGVWKYAGLVGDDVDWTTSSKVNKQSFVSDGNWQYAVINLRDVIGANDSMMQYITRVGRTGLYLPNMESGESLDIAYVAYFGSSTEEKAKAQAFGAEAVNYMNSEPKVTTSSTTKSYGNSRTWKSGNNKGFGLLYATGAGNWNGSTVDGYATTGGSNTVDAYGYDSWMIGYATNMYSNTGFNSYRRNPVTGEKYTAKYTTTTSTLTLQNVSGTTNNIYFINGSSSEDGVTNGGYNTSILDFDGYQLLETVTSGVMTAGLLEGSLRTVRVDNVEYRVPVYRQETVEYIAYLLLHSLRIPQRDASGNYNMNFVSGSKSSQFGGVDMNGDGKIGMINLDGDSRNGNECDENSVDLATALRYCLGISFNVNTNVGTGGEMGTYAETLKKDDLLLGKFSDCRYSIKTAMDAAYYMLNSLFIANSWNQKQDDYYYLEMPTATLEMDGRTGTAYVFDAGFTTGKTASDGTVFTDDGTNKNAISYSPVIKADGTAGTGTIYMNNVTGKTQFNYGSTGTAYTTRFPFLPVTDAEGEYAGGTYSYCFWDDDQREYHTGSNSLYQANASATDYTTNRRNYNYVIASNGEFLYKEEDNLFFDFEGDDDVYLFINGELVLDIGAGHSITSVYIDVNDYVEKAREAMKPLAKYGYTSDMTAEEFDDLIDAAYLDEYIYDSITGKITGTQSVKNPYTADQIRELKRWARLDLVDGQICQFDFYYMERHSWGANMRIVTNMHITDPALDVDKTAYQYGQEIEFGGVIDPTASLEYNFALTNSGNQKLYNLTFKDDVIGVTLDPTNGLTVQSDKNGIYILDGNGHALEAMDLTATVSGYNTVGQYVEIPIEFPDKDGDGGQTALKNFLKSLNAEGTESGYDDAEVTHAGSGLWVDATVTIKGIHYMLTPDQMKAGQVHNTVFLTATTRIDPNKVGNQNLKSDAEHLIYTSGFPVHYQWAKHNIFIKMAHLLTEAKKEAETAGTQLNLYYNFFNSVDDLGDIHYNLCDKYGRTDGYYAYHTKTNDTFGNPGYAVNYQEPGIYTFYLLLYKQVGANKKYAPSGVDAEDIAEGEYAIVRTQVYVADVEDSVYVLDYGLNTESLDVGGELFKNDYLFGPYGSIRARLMGVTGTQPSYVDPMDPELTNGTEYCRIAFQCQNISASNTITTPDGVYKVNLAIPNSGKLIGYDSATGEYTLTGVGTVKISAIVPTTTDTENDPWKQTYLYYWYDDGTSGPAWPGTPMKSLGAGQFEIDIPADVTNVIINNGSGALQTDDLKITPGLESTITVTVTNGNQVSADIATIVEEVNIHVKVPSDWEKVYLHHWHDNGESTEYPGEEITSQPDGDGYRSIILHGDVTHMVISDGANSQSGDLTVYAGKEAWIEVTDTESGSVENEDGTTTTYYNTIVKYTLSEGYTVHAMVPQNWKEDVYIYYWHEGMTDDEMKWPGKKMTKGEFDWYTFEGVPADVTQIVINDDVDGTMGLGDHQTVDLAITPGLETWITVNSATVDNNGIQKNTAKVAYGSESSSTGLTFTPRDFMDESNDLWLAITVHSTSFNPSVLNPTQGNPTVNIHNETQMYKKVSIIPATVVYYEDTFGAVEYNKNVEGSENVFTHHGVGSGQLSQSIDQDQPYGQDAAYQSGENDLYSGESLTEVDILDRAKESLISTFDFKGTGFEIISRTIAVEPGSFMARVYKKDAYSADAYDKYMDAAQAYMEVTTKNFYISKGYTDANDRWEVAISKYQYAKTMYDAAKAAYDAAVANPEDAALQSDYVVKFTAAYEAFEAYEQARLKYVENLATYEKALQDHTGKKDGYAVCTEKGACTFVYSEALEDFSTALVLGNQPAAPVAPEALVTIVQPTLPTSPCVTIAMVYTQFDHGDDGGAEGINQVPVIRVKGLNLDEYVVEVVGMPTYTFDENYEISGVQPTKLFIDGVRIYQPMGPTHEAYNDKEDKATVEELRDLISNGDVAVGVVGSTGLNISSGTTTWTESLFDNDFSSANKETYNTIKVESTADYLIQGPNNEVYMEGNATNSALIFYVKEDASEVHELQIAARALDYGRYYGAGSTGLNVQLQYGVLSGNGYAWKNLVQVVSGTEQYYVIPYDECPMDTQGRYQIVLRAVNPNAQSNAMVSYTNVKLNGLTIEKVDGVGEGSIIYYQNGILVKPQYELIITEDASLKPVEIIPFNGSELTMTLTREWTYVYLRSTFSGEVYDFFSYEDPGQVTSATMWRYDSEYAGGSRRTFGIHSEIGNEITFKIKQPSERKIELSYCLHTYGEGFVAREPNCSIAGIFAYKCVDCGHIKQEPIATNDTHHYSGGICKYCGAQEPKYYLVGYINGKNHGCEQDFENMGDYLFVDGKLRVKFEKDSYVYLKADGNKAWYMVPAYVTKDTATFYDTTTGEYGEKMYVPCGVELLLTLTVNDDGSLTLHYEEPCIHDWGTGEVTWEATCTADGERTYTCSKCFSTKKEMIPATGHIYVNGICNCGDIQYRTIYFKNTDGWANVFLYTWDADGKEHSARWPGDQLQLAEGETDIYTATIPAYLNVVFNDGSGTKTADLTIPQYGDMYDWSIKNWVNYSGEVDYYLVGSINGVDYGCGDNSNNMGIYKFVDGKLTVTFDKESYVFVKTTGNAAWYMCQSYCETFSDTLYNTTTGANEKMFVPAGTQLEFVLTVNDDDTLNLVAHAWGGVVTKDPTCTEVGEKTYTCYLCNDSYTEEIPANGHSFVDDICSVCGAENTRIIYFKNTAGWENVYIYAFTEGSPATEYTGVWPGALMSLVEGETDLYYYVVSAKAKSVIFNNGSGGAGNQTDNLHAPIDENNKYTYGANVWTPVDEEVELPEPELDYLYLQPGDWNVDSAWFAAYFFGNGDTWVKMTDEDGDGIYRCVKPEGYPNVIFCRMNKAMTDLGWDSKWNQTVDLTIPTDGKNFFTITNPWNGTDGKGDGVWSIYVCDHSYTEKVTTAAGCETVGEKTFTCSKCGDKYTEEIASTGHSYTDGACTVCGGKDPSYVDKVYLLPNSNWKDADAWFAAWFIGADTWATMTDPNGNGYYECEIPEGATGIVFVRMNPAATAPSWNDGEKWNQTVDLTVEANRLYVIENPWNEAFEWKATGSWTDYDPSVAQCDHSYTEEITTPAGCTTTGVKTYTCSKCGDSYTETIAASGHNYVNGSCTNCGEADADYVEKVYLKPGSSWMDSDAWFAAYFFDNGETWVTMTASETEGIYECEIPEGYPSVIFVRMNPTATAPSWNDGEKWNQTVNLTVEADRLYVIENPWNEASEWKATGYWTDINSSDTECEHSYTEAITTAATCTTAGEKTFTCDLCGDSYTEEIAALGHSYVDGTCENCGEAESVETRTIYFRNTDGWSTVYIWAWDYSETNYTGGNWPGAAMSLVDGESDLYYYEVSVDAEYCLFNNGSGTQTSNQTIPTDDQTKYTYSADAWTALDVEPDTEATGTDYCIIGWIEGADSGTGGDYTNCDSYKFTVVDGTGSIDVTFTQDAYIGVKKADNSTWYWTNYSEETSCTFYSSGYGDKQKVPAGSWTITLVENDDGSVTMSYAAAASYSLRSTKKVTKAAAADVTMPESYIYGDEEFALNLPAINAQMSSDAIYGQPDEIISGAETVSKIDINSAALVLSDDISMNYYVTVPENAEDVYMTFQLNGETTVMTDYTVDAKGRYVFRFDGINAQKMGDDICATAYATINGKYISDCVEAYSVRAYCVSQLNKYADDAKLVRLISDLLVYGAKNQIYQGYKTDKLVTEGLELSQSTFSGVDESENQLQVSGLAHKDVRYSGVTLVLGNKVVLRLTISTDKPDAFTYTVNSCGVDTVYTAEDLVKVSDGKYYLYFDQLKATGFDETVTATISCDGQIVSQTVTYSVNSYIQKNQNVEDEALRELVRAIYNYGCSADDFAG